MTDPAALASSIVDGVMANLLGRRGFRQTWDGIDEDVKDEIIESLNHDVFRKLQEAGR